MWSAEQVDEVVWSYRMFDELSRGSTHDRQRADAEHWWAWETVNRAVLDGNLPIEVLDEMLHDPDADHAHRVYVAAGPIEDLLSDHPEDYADLIAERCRTDRVWASTVEHVWLEPDDWRELPESLRRLVPGPSGSSSRGGGQRSQPPSGKRPRPRR